MRRLLGNSGSIIKFNYLKNHKKPIVEVPSKIPPKYVYEIKYHPTSMPDFDMKFKDHAHFDQWHNIFYGEEDKYEFQYSGQWWNAIGITGRIGFLVSAIWLFVALKDSAEERKQKHLPGLLSYYTVGDVPTSHLPTHIQS